MLTTATHTTITKDRAIYQPQSSAAISAREVVEPAGAASTHLVIWRQAHHPHNAGRGVPQPRQRANQQGSRRHSLRVPISRMARRATRCRRAAW